MNVALEAGGYYQQPAEHGSCRRYASTADAAGEALARPTHGRVSPHEWPSQKPVGRPLWEIVRCRCATSWIPPSTGSPSSWVGRPVQREASQRQAHPAFGSLAGGDRMTAASRRCGGSGRARRSSVSGDAGSEQNAPTTSSSVVPSRWPEGISDGGVSCGRRSGRRIGRASGSRRFCPFRPSAYRRQASLGISDNGVACGFVEGESRPLLRTVLPCVWSPKESPAGYERLGRICPRLRKTQCQAVAVDINRRGTVVGYSEGSGRHPASLPVEPDRDGLGLGGPRGRWERPLRSTGWELHRGRAVP